MTAHREFAPRLAAQTHPVRAARGVDRGVDRDTPVNLANRLQAAAQVLDHAEDDPRGLVLDPILRVLVRLAADLEPGVAHFEEASDRHTRRCERGTRKSEGAGDGHG